MRTAVAPLADPARPSHGTGSAGSRLGDESGQAAVEWVGLVLLCSVALGALGTAVGPHFDGRALGGFLAHRLVCAVKGGCHDGDRQLARAYGPDLAALARRHAPNITYEPGEAQLPVDWRRCRRRSCADGPNDRDLDVHRSHRGERATLFVRVIRRGRRTYLQYWLYFPDSNSAVAGLDKVWERSQVLRALGRWPGFHLDDWEGYAVRIDPTGRAWARATSHRHWQSCKWRECRDRWLSPTGWTRVSRGSHAGHLPVGRRARERSSTADGLRLIPLETLDRSRYRPRDPDVKPPWEKDAYWDPTDPRS